MYAFCIHPMFSYKITFFSHAFLTSCAAPSRPVCHCPHFVALAEHFLHKCDLLFAIGSSLFPNRFSHAIPDASKKTIVQCTVDTLDIHRSYKTDYALIGDAKLTLQALIQELSAQTGGGVRKNQALIDEIKAGKEAFLAKFRPLMESNEKPINPYRVYGDLMKVLDPQKSFVTGDSGNTRDQISTVYEALIPRGFLGWGNVSTLGFSLAAALGAKLAYPDRQCVNITGDAGVSYMMGNFEAVARYGLGVTTIHINNGGFAGYGPGFWGPGHDPYTHEVSDHSKVCMASMARAQGYHAEDVTEPSEIIPALRRALEANAKRQPAFLEFICSQHPVYGGWVRDAAGWPLIPCTATYPASLAGYVVEQGAAPEIHTPALCSCDMRYCRACAGGRRVGG